MLINIQLTNLSNQTVLVRQTKVPSKLLKVQLQPNVHIEINVDDVRQTGAFPKGQKQAPLKLKKVGANLLIVDEADEEQVEFVDFFNTPNVVLAGEDWADQALTGLQYSSEGVISGIEAATDVVLVDAPLELAAAPLAAPAIFQGLQGLLGIGSVGAGILSGIGGSDGDGATATGENAALALIQVAAQNNTATSTSLSVQIYATAGITGVTSTNLNAINSAMNTLAVDGANTGTKPNVQKIVDAYNKIFAMADGGSSAGDTLTLQEWSSLGVDMGTAASNVANLSLLNSIVDKENAAGVASVANLNELARIANAIALTAAGGTPTPPLTAADLAKIGLIGVTDSIASGNLSAVLGAISAEADDGSGTATLAQLQTLATNAINKRFVQGDITAGDVVASNDLRVEVYSIASNGAEALLNTGAVDAGGAYRINIGSYTGAVRLVVKNLGANPDYLDEATNLNANLSLEMQALSVVSGTDTQINITPLTHLAAVKNPTPTVGSIVAINAAVGLAFGLVDITTTKVITINNPVIASTDDSSNGKKYGWVLAALSGMDAQSGSMDASIDLLVHNISVSTVSNSPTKATLNEVAKTNVVAGAMAAAAQTPTDMVTQIIRLVGAQQQSVDLAKIEVYNNGTTPAALTLADYIAAGVSGVTSDNLAAVNAQVLAQAPGGADTVAEVQAIVTVAALAKIANYADNNTNPVPTANDYRDAGITGVTADNLTAVNTQVDGAIKTAADQVSEVQAVVNTANQNLTVITLSANTLTENTTFGAAGIEVGTLTVSDPDGNGNTGLVLSLSGTDAASFDIVAGKLMFTGSSPNFEAMPSYSVTVTSTDGSLVTSQAFTVNVTDVNEVPTAIALSANTIAENVTVGAGVEIGTLTVTDPDASGNNNELSLIGTDAASFAIVAGKLMFTGSSPNFEAKPSYSVTVTSTDGSLVTSQAFTVNVTNINEAAGAITVSANEDTSVTEAGGVANGTNTNATASGTLSVVDVDSGQSKFTAPASLVGTYGNFTFNADTGAWTYSLRNGDANVQALQSSDSVTDKLTVTSLDGTQTKDIVVTITGANDAAGPITVSANEDTSVTEAGGINNATDTKATASGTLSVVDVDSGQSKFTAPASLVGTYGNFTFNADTGAWTYSLRNGDANVQALQSSDSVTDKLTVTSLDGTQTKDIVVTITGANDAPTLSAFVSVIGTVNADTQATITLANLKAQGNEADLDGTVDAFVIKAVSTGTLLIGASAETATLWAAGSNDTVNSTNNAYWTGAPNANGTLNAFTAVAKDNSGAESATAIQALMSVTADAPTLASQLGGVANLDVASNLVFTSSVALKLGTSGFIRILDQNTSGAGFRNDTNDNDQTIDLANASDRGLVTLSDDGKTITINPKWDLDLSSNYRIVVDQGAFVSQADEIAAQALTVDFATVTPGNLDSSATKTIQALSTASQTMNADGTLDANNRWWFDVERIGDIIQNMTQLGDLSDKSYVLVAKNYSTEPGGPINIDDIYEAGANGIEIQETHVGFLNFGANDQIYFDSQANDISVQKFDRLYNEIYSNDTGDGHLDNQNIFSFGTTLFKDGVATDTGQSYIGLSLEGQINYQKIDLLYAISGFPEYLGLDQVIGSAHPVIMA